MSNRPTKAASNVYCQARKAAAEHEQVFNSREGAAQKIGCDPRTLANYELNMQLVPPDIVAIMADVYDAPELLTHYCACDCPIGPRRGFSEVVERPLELITVRAFNATREIDETNRRLMDIIEDGRVSEDEQPAVREIVEQYRKIVDTAQELLLWATKNGILGE